MPQWIHDRARHIQAKNPGMAESTAFAIATQQAHAVGKSPKDYGTPEGRKKAKAKYDTPKDDKKTADPGGIGKEAGLIEYPFPQALLDGFVDYLQKTAQLTLASVAPKPTISSQVTSRMPRNTLSAKTPQYSQVNSASMPGPAQTHQPVLSPPPVRG